MGPVLSSPPRLLAALPNNQNEPTNQPFPPPLTITKMFKKPSKSSSAIPIVNPSSGEVQPELSSPLVATHEALMQQAIQRAADAVAALKQNNPPLRAQRNSPYDRAPINTETSQNAPITSRTVSTSAPQHVGDPLVFNVYARPFVPHAYIVINQLPGRVVYSTIPNKVINFDAYINHSLGPAAAFLPIPPQLPPSAPARPIRINTPVPQTYEAFFQYSLNQEAEAENQNANTYSLYGHEVVIKPASAISRPGEATCTLYVPGLSENTPYVEEDDVLELRQLRYGSDGALFGMSSWLAMREVTGNQALSDPSRTSGEAPGWTNIIYYARVSSVLRTTEMLVLRVLGLPAPLVGCRELFNVQFQVPVERRLMMQYAVVEAQRAFSHGGWFSSMLFPTNQDCEIQEQLHPGIFNQEFFDKNLNWEQKKAVESIWSRSYGTLPYLISGPPGTGKTKTIIETALQLVKNTEDFKHILLCAPSDPAADTLCQRLLGYLGPNEMLRLARPCRTFAEVPDMLLSYCCIENDEFALPQFQTLMKYRVVVTTCRDASLLTRARMTNADLCAVQQNMRRVSGAIHPFDPQPEVKLHWSAVLIDEAAQAMEPEALIPLTIVAPDQYAKNSSPLVVMAGDEYQLGPMVSQESSPLKESLFSRLFKRAVYSAHPLARGMKGKAPPPLTRSLLPVFKPAFTNLVRNYRSHPAILAVPSNLFYNDTLEPEATGTGCLAGWEGWCGRGWPVLFHNNPSDDELELPGLTQGTGGWYNRGEADVACSYAESLVRLGKVDEKEVCIMSPFKAQVRYLRQCMRKAQYGGLWGVNIGPTEAFQGLEKGVVILCVTRAKQSFVEQDRKLGWGIIGMPNKMNVALTRAKFGLVVVGKRELLVEDPNWKAFVDFCERNGLVTGGSGTCGDISGGTNLGTLTRLENVLIDKEQSMRKPPSRAWGMARGVELGQEMWQGGMAEMPDVYESDYNDDYGYAHEN